MPISALSHRAGFNLLPFPLSRDVRDAIRFALANDVVFERGASARAIFQNAVDAAIRSIKRKRRHHMVERFLVDGPFGHKGRFPKREIGKHLTDDETNSVVNFVYSSVVKAFQGGLAELLAVPSVLDLMDELKAAGKISQSARLFVGDSVLATRRGEGWAKAADMHVLTVKKSGVRVHAVAEVKSYEIPAPDARRQLAQHAARCTKGLLVRGAHWPDTAVACVPARPFAVWVRPSAWTLPRGFRFEHDCGRKLLHVDEPEPPSTTDAIEKMGPGVWRVTLRWSHEALAAAAFALSLWYVERIGEAAFAERGKNPWPEMTPAQAGRNAATQALYYAIRRVNYRHNPERAIALYNVHGFGYSLGMNFYDKRGKRKMLWAQDLDEIVARGRARRDCRIFDKRPSKRLTRGPDSAAHSRPDTSRPARQPPQRGPTISSNARASIPPSR